MRVVFLASEAAPIAKVGGLADVVGSLPKALAKLGVEAKIILPKYGVIDTGKFLTEPVTSNLEVFFNDNLEKFRVYKTLLPKSTVEVFLIDHSFFENGVYLTPSATPKNLSEVARFAFFQLSALEFLANFGKNFDVVHLNDWHTALVPILKKIKYNKTKLANSATVLTIHNLGKDYQGIAKGKFLHALDLEPEPVSFLTAKFQALRRLNVFASLNFLECGIETTNILNTVSPQYASEIKTLEFGGKLSATLRKRAHEFYGILNGIDYETFNPKTDANLVQNYDKTSWKEGKKANKGALIAKLGWRNDEKILAAMVTRLDEQKGLDLILKSLPILESLGLKFVILGKGDPKIEEKLARFCKINPDIASCTFKFDPALAALIYAGADIFLMPSRFEPCGLGQMIAMRYGTIPVVHDVGGLHDTVEDKVTGFKFAEFKAKDLVEAVTRAMRAFQDKNVWSKMVDNAMTKDFSWAKSAAEYVKLYQRAIREHSDKNQ